MKKVYLLLSALVMTGLSFGQGDMTPPVITFTPLGNTSSLTPRTLTTTITDQTGVYLPAGSVSANSLVCLYHSLPGSAIHPNPVAMGYHDPWNCPAVCRYILHNTTEKYRNFSVNIRARDRIFDTRVTDLSTIGRRAPA